jgi:single-strand DNA-binding protein
MLQITAVGYLAADPELKTVKTKNGDQQVAKFTLLVNKRVSGEDRVNRLNCSVWGPRSKTVDDYLTKGSQVTITGQGYIEAFERKDGSPGACLDVSVAEFSLPVKPKAVADDSMPF